jgi:hypothetical protein
VTDVRTDRLDPGEQVHLWAPAGLDGLEMMHARFISQQFPRHTHDEYGFGVIETGALGFF